MCGVLYSMTDTLRRQLAADLDDGFIAVVDAFGSMVLSIAMRLGDPDGVDDITQETFTRAYRALRDGGPECLDEVDLRPWLATIAFNLVRNEWRRRSRKATVPLPVEDAASGVASAMTTEAAVIDKIAVEEVRALLDLLPSPQRDVIVLRHVVGLSTRETAHVLGCPVGTVKSHLARGIATLRPVLESRGQE